jgi:hypothetical protein
MTYEIYNSKVRNLQIIYLSHYQFCMEVRFEQSERIAFAKGFQISEL